MLSSVAERLYWFARYVERAEDTARLIHVNTNFLLDLPKGTSFSWESLLYITGCDKEFFTDHTNVNEKIIVNYLVGDLNNSGSILSSLVSARENLRTTRDIITREAWEKLNDVYLYAKANINIALSRKDRFTYLQRIIEGSQMMSGLLSSSMSHDASYDFVRIGRNLERADMTSRILDVRLTSLLNTTQERYIPFENIQWMSVLKSLSAYQMYRRHVHVRVSGEAVLRYLLLDVDFPRSVLHCLGEIAQSLSHLPRNALPYGYINDLKRDVTEVEVNSLTKGGKLHEFIDELQIKLAILHHDLQTTYFLADTAQSQSQVSES